MMTDGMTKLEEHHHQVESGPTQHGSMGMGDEEEQQPKNADAATDNAKDLNTDNGDNEKIEAPAAAIPESTSPATTTNKRLRIPAKYRNKKPADMPRRPLSAYNLFFRDQRAQIMAERAQGISDPSLDGGGGGGAGLFESMAKTIAARWKNIAPEQLETYAQQAQEDTIRYRAEMERYNKKFEQDKCIAAKMRRADNRRRRQQEKAQLKSLASNNKLTNTATTTTATLGQPEESATSATNHHTFPNHAFLSMTQAAGTVNFPASSLRMEQPSEQVHQYVPADMQVRLLAAHAEGLSRAIPPTPNHQMAEYLRQLNAAQASPAFQQQLTPNDPTRQAAGDPGRDVPPTDNTVNYDSHQAQDPLSILQILQQQQNARYSNTTDADLENLYALQQLQRSGQLQMAAHPPQQQHMVSFNQPPSLGQLLLQLQQQQRHHQQQHHVHYQQQQQQQQHHEMGRLNADTNFYQQQQQEQGHQHEEGGQQGGSDPTPWQNSGNRNN